LPLGEVRSRDLDRFGKDRREFPYHKGWKQVRCPYWHRTDYGMVRCEFLRVEGRDEDDPEARSKALAHLGSELAFAAANRSSYLDDKIKLCEVNEEEEDPER
jgi:hypothetical protein